MIRSTPMDDPPTTRTTPPDQVAQLAAAYGRMVFCAAFQVLGDHAQAEDVQQDVFLRLMQRPMPEVVSWPAMLKTLAVRMAIDRLRRHTHWQRLIPIWRAGARQDADGADHHATRLQQARQLRHALAKLRPREAECFSLRCLQGMDIDSIASATGMKANHVSVCLHRATRKLESELRNVAPNAEETYS